MLTEQVRTIYLAAGQGSRLLPYTADKAKWQLEVGGQGILERIIGCAHECGVADVVVVRGSVGGSVRCPSVRYVDDLACQNMVHSLFAAKDYLKGEVVVSYADILYEPTVLQTLLASPAPVSVVVDLNWESYFRTRADDPRSVAESLVLDGTKIRSIGQPLARDEWPDGQYIGLIKFSHDGTELLRSVYEELKRVYRGKAWRNAATFEKAYFTDLLQELVDRDVDVQAIPIRGGWVEFDTRNDYEQVVQWVTTGEVDRYIRLDMLPQHTSVLSAGGVVVRKREGVLEALFVGDGREGKWRLPKGMQESGENIIETAQREVREETGIETAIEGYLSRASWSYTYDGMEWDERVHFFLMRPLGGALEWHDSEFPQAVWMSIHTGLSELQYDSERRVLAIAAQHLGMGELRSREP